MLCEARKERHVETCARCLRRQGNRPASISPILFSHESHSLNEYLRRSGVGRRINAAHALQQVTGPAPTFLKKMRKSPQVRERPAVTGSDKQKRVSQKREKYFSKALKFP
jgi:hypothetical protein